MVVQSTPQRGLVPHLFWALVALFFMQAAGGCINSKLPMTDIPDNENTRAIHAKVVAYKEWLKANRTLPTAEIMKTTVSKLRGHFAYYGVTDNSKSIQSFAYWVTKTLYKCKRRFFPPRQVTQNHRWALSQK